jgi:hypothetical protein
MELIITSSSITEPITKDEVKAFMGYPLTDTSQDTLLDRFITSAREWLEGRTALSLVLKSYKAYYEPMEADEGWYEVPVVPVASTPTLVVKMNDVVTTFEQKGLKRIFVRPDKTFSTIQVGASSDIPYLTIEFDAGATNESANAVLLELISVMFNHRDSGVGVSYSRLPFDLQQRVNGLSNNL